MAIIIVLAVAVAISSYLAYTYLYILENMLSPEVATRHGYRLYICDLQQQLGYEACHVDGIVIDFNDLPEEIDR